VRQIAALVPAAEAELGRFAIGWRGPAAFARDKLAHAWIVWRTGAARFGRLTHVGGLNTTRREGTSFRTADVLVRGGCEVSTAPGNIQCARRTEVLRAGTPRPGRAPAALRSASPKMEIDPAGLVGRDNALGVGQKDASSLFGVDSCSAERHGWLSIATIRGVGRSLAGE